MNVTGHLGKRVPDYEPSNVVHEWLGGRILSTPDPVSKVSEFYLDVAAKSGWTILANHTTPQSATLVIKEFPWGAAISIHPDADATQISIHTYPSLW